MWIKTSEKSRPLSETLSRILSLSLPNTNDRPTSAQTNKRKTWVCLPTGIIKNSSLQLKPYPQIMQSKSLTAIFPDPQSPIPNLEGTLKCSEMNRNWYRLMKIHCLDCHLLRVRSAHKVLADCKRIQIWVTARTRTGDLCLMGRYKLLVKRLWAQRIKSISLKSHWLKITALHMLITINTCRQIISHCIRLNQLRVVLSARSTPQCSAWKAKTQFKQLTPTRKDCWFATNAHPEWPDIRKCSVTNTHVRINNR